jgi:hypothetical protein
MQIFSQRKMPCLTSSLRSRASQRRLRVTERRRRERARGAARAPRRCARSPLGERAAVEWHQRRFFASARPNEAASSAPSRSHRRRRSRGGAPARSRARPHTDERWSGSTRASRRSTTHVSAADGGREEIRVRNPIPLSLSFLFLSSFSFFLLLLLRPRKSCLARLWYQMWGILLLGARSDGYNVRRNRFVVPRPKP